MKIKTRLRYIFWLSNVVAVTVGFLLFYNAQSIAQEIGHLRIVGTIRQGIAEISALHNDYLETKDASILMRIRQRYEGIDLALTEALGAFRDGPTLADVRDISRMKNRNAALFDSLLKKSPQGGAPWDERIISDIRSNSYTNIAITHTMNDRLLKRLYILQQRMLVLIVVFTLTLLTGIWMAIHIIWSYFVKRILLIRQGSSIIAGGNFHFSWSDDADDEIGELSKDLSAMAIALSASYGKLEDKVEERTKELMKAKESLETKVHELEEANAKNRAILASMDDGVIATDKDGIIMLVNPKAQALLKWTPEDVVGKPVMSALDVRDATGAVLPENERPIPRALKKQAPIHANATYEFVRSDGIAFPVYVAASPIVFDGNVIGALEVFRDVTEEKEIERAKSEFISVAAHQLRTPAAAINWYLERLIHGRIGALTGKQMDYFREIERNNHRMIKLVNTLLNVSRLEVGALKIQPVPVDIAKLIQKTLAELRPMIEKKGIKVKTEFGKDSSGYFDPELLAIVTSNILSNAVNYTAPRGVVHVGATRVPVGARVGGTVLSEDSMLITVADTGYGIPEREQSRLFRKFFRANNARRKHTDGSGLGLYIVKSILDKTGGHIWFTSAEDKGTTFYITVPLLAHGNDGSLAISTPV
jgi:PAS domain S-box-containing protein